MKWVSHDIIFLRKPPGVDYHLIFRDRGTNPILRKALFTNVLYILIGLSHVNDSVFPRITS